MELGILGLPKSGKCTVFNALTRREAETSAYSIGTIAPNIGVVKVPDPKLDNPTAILKPKRALSTEVRYIDVSISPKGFGRGKGIVGQFLAQLSKAYTLIHVVRVFTDDSTPHIEGCVDPERDVATLDLELTFSDLSIIEKRLEKLKTSLKGAKSTERELALREHPGR